MAPRLALTHTSLGALLPPMLLEPDYYENDAVSYGDPAAPIKILKSLWPSSSSSSSSPVIGCGPVRDLEQGSVWHSKGSAGRALPADLPNGKEDEQRDR